MPCRPNIKTHLLQYLSKQMPLIIILSSNLYMLLKYTMIFGGKNNNLRQKQNHSGNTINTGTYAAVCESVCSGNHGETCYFKVQKPHLKGTNLQYLVHSSSCLSISHCYAVSNETSNFLQIEGSIVKS